MSSDPTVEQPPRAASGSGALAPDSLQASAPRFLVEILAWVGAPWALVAHGIWPAVLADVLLIGIPTVFGMPGAEKQRNPVAVGAPVAIVLELLQPAAACVSAAVIWPPGAFWLVVVLSVAACVLQIPRWRWMLAARL